MEISSNHIEIKNLLESFILSKKVPNILFYGPNGSGKRTIIYNFIDKIYENENISKQNYVMFVNCAHGKGIKFIREDIKYFSKTNINYDNGNIFKSIILSNADKLTIDAQSALRRCIELFSHCTRFFIIVEDKEKLLKPILSRFSEVYIPYPEINNNFTNYYKYNLQNKENKNFNIIKKNLYHSNPLNIIETAEKLYDKGVCGLDIIEYIEKNYENNKKKFDLLFAISKIKKEIKIEKFIIVFILNIINNETNLNEILLS